MRRTGVGNRLDTGDVFPDVSLDLIDGTILRLPEAMSGRYFAALFYRGHW
jgi:hypothetical protein